MSISGIKRVLENFNKQISSRPALLVFDGCLMSQIEVLYELRGLSKYVVASEDVNYGSYPYQAIFKNLSQRTGAVSPEEFADDVFIALADPVRVKDFPASAIIDMDEVSAVGDGFSSLSGLLAQYPVPREEMVKIIGNTQGLTLLNGNEFPLQHYRDLRHFILNLKRSSVGDKVAPVCDDLLSTMSRLVVKSSRYAEHKISGNYLSDPLSYNEVNGISLFLPTNGWKLSGNEKPLSGYRLPEIMTEYNSLEFSGFTGFLF
jgi:hypothetical protein